MKTGHKINIIIETDTACPDKAVLRKVAWKTLALEAVQNNISLNLLITGDERIAQLNKQFLKRQGPTDVLAFSAKGRNPIKKNLKGFIGEIAISAETAEHNAERFNTTKEDEIFLYIIHGILHLLGYRDGAGEEKKAMQGRESRILKEICRQENS